MIPGFIITILTFPGVIVHELAHELVCALLGVRVRKVCYFRVGNPPGYVVHDSPETVMGHILIGTGPFLVNSVVGVVLGLVFAMGLFRAIASGVYCSLAGGVGCDALVSQHGRCQEYVAGAVG